MSVSIRCSVALSSPRCLSEKATRRPSHDGATTPIEIEPSGERVCGSSSTRSSPSRPSFQYQIAFSAVAGLRLKK